MKRNRKWIIEESKKIALETELEKLKLDENTRAALDIDSFDSLRFIVALDEKLGINIPEADYGKTGTLTSLIEYINAKKVRE